MNKGFRKHSEKEENQKGAWKEERLSWVISKGTEENTWGGEESGVVVR